MKVKIERRCLNFFWNLNGKEGKWEGRGEMAVRQKAVATLPALMRAMRKGTPNPNHMPLNQPLPSLRRAFSLYDQINLIDNVPEDQLRFQQYFPILPSLISFLLIFCMRLFSCQIRSIYDLFELNFI